MKVPGDAWRSPPYFSLLSTIPGIGLQSRVVAFLLVLLLILSVILPSGASCTDQLQALAICYPFIARPPLGVDPVPTDSCCQFFLSSYDLHTAGCFCVYCLGETVGLPIDSLRLLSLDFLCNSSHSLRRICAAAPDLADTDGVTAPLDVDDSHHPVSHHPLRGQAVHHDWKQSAWIALCQSYAPEHTGPALKLENMHHPVGSSIPNTFTNGGSSLHTSMHTAVDMSAHASRIDAPPNMLSTQSSNMGLMQGINGGRSKQKLVIQALHLTCLVLDGNVLEARPTIGDAAVASFSSVESNSQPLNESLLDADISSFGFLGQIPRNFSLSDLTADFSQSSDILESYPRSPFLVTDNENFLDSREREHQGDNRRLDTISEGLSYEDFGSELL